MTIHQSEAGTSRRQDGEEVILGQSVLQRLVGL